MDHDKSRQIFLNSDRVEYKCTFWPASTNVGCTGPGDFKALDKTMNISMTANCEALCVQERETGCCNLGDQSGCYWKNGEPPGLQSNSTQMSKSVACFPIGTYLN